METYEWALAALLTVLVAAIAIKTARHQPSKNEEIITRAIMYTLDRRGKRRKVEPGGSSSSSAPLLSIVIPAYNEESRLVGMLESAHTYLKSALGSTSYEFVLVNDGSTDSTVDVAVHWASANNLTNLFRWIEFPVNCGKGAAVCSGILRARGKWVLFADADGATQFQDLGRLLNAVPGNWKSSDQRVVVIGSRSHLVNTKNVIQRSRIRNVLMYMFHMLLYIMVGPIRFIPDTQCGFKLFSQTAARLLIPNLHIHRWIFDIEILLRAYWLNIPILQVPVNWTEVPGSKISLVTDSVRMFVDVLMLRVFYKLGIWDF